MTPACIHCQRPYRSRSGRGLCRTCWQDKATRERYPKVAPFGSWRAARISHIVRRANKVREMVPFWTKEEADADLAETKADGE